MALCADKAFPEVLRFVQKYMLSDVAARLDRSNIKQVLTLPASRICLDPRLDNAGGIQLSQDTVDRHLQLLIAPNHPSEPLKTATPPGPVVVEAAGAILVEGGIGGRAIDTWSDCI